MKNPSSVPCPNYPSLFEPLQSQLLKHFLCCMLHPDPNKRYSVSELLKHPYVLSIDYS